MKHLISLLLLLQSLSVTALDLVFPGSVYFGYVPEGSSESRTLSICDSRFISAETPEFMFSDPNVAEIFSASAGTVGERCLKVTIQFTP